VRFQNKIAIVTGAAQGNASWVTGQIFAVDGGQIVRL
jgi:NAD(P)-dependent dehydrogenase (short-subunit alcohol dehydrogenase family)